MQEIIVCTSSALSAVVSWTAKLLDFIFAIKCTLTKTLTILLPQVQLKPVYLNFIVTICQKKISISLTLIIGLSLGVQSVYAKHFQLVFSNKVAGHSETGWEFSTHRASDSLMLNWLIHDSVTAKVGRHACGVCIIARRRLIAFWCSIWQNVATRFHSTVAIL